MVKNDVSYVLFHPEFSNHPSVYLTCSSFLSDLQGIGRMILKEEMKARSGCHDNDQWGSRRSSHCSSREALNNVGLISLNGCKSELASVFKNVWAKGDFTYYMFNITV